MNNFLKSLVVLSVLLSGCAVKNDHTDVGLGLAYRSNLVEGADGTFIASAEASLLRGRVGGASELTMQDAEKKCNEMGKKVKVVKNDTDSNLIVNGVSRLTFKCE